MYKAVKAAIPVALCAASLMVPVGSAMARPHVGSAQAVSSVVADNHNNNRDRCRRDDYYWRHDHNWWQHHRSEYRWWWNHCRHDYHN